MKSGASRSFPALAGHVVEEARAQRRQRRAPGVGVAQQHDGREAVAREVAGRRPQGFLARCEVREVARGRRHVVRGGEAGQRQGGGLRRRRGRRRAVGARDDGEGRRVAAALENDGPHLPPRARGEEAEDGALGLGDGLGREDLREPTARAGLGRHRRLENVEPAAREVERPRRRPAEEPHGRGLPGEARGDFHGAVLDGRDCVDGQRVRRLEARRQEHEVVALARRETRPRAQQLQLVAQRPELGRPPPLRRAGLAVDDDEVEARVPVQEPPRALEHAARRAARRVDEPLERVVRLRGHRRVREALEDVELERRQRAALAPPELAHDDVGRVEAADGGEDVPLLQAALVRRHARALLGRDAGAEQRDLQHGCAYRQRMVQRVRERITIDEIIRVGC